MEVVGIALSVVGLFSACIDCYQLVRRGAALDKDYKILETKFNNQELRLSTWGRACGLVSATEYDTRLDEPVLKTRIIATLECIRELFLDEKELKKRFGLKSWRERSSLLPATTRSPLTIGNSYTSSSELAPRRKRESFFFWKKQQRSLTRFQNHAAWAIYDKEKFSELVQHLKDFNDDLEAMTRPLDGVYARQIRIVQMEIEEIDDMETLEEIALASQNDADVISDTVSLRIESIRSGRSTTGPASSGTTKSFKSALTSIPATINEVLQENAAAQIALPLVAPPQLGRYKYVPLDGPPTSLLI
jgi:Ras family protein A